MVSNEIKYPTYESTIKVVIGDTLQKCCDEENLPWEENLDIKFDAYVQRVRNIIYIVLRRNNSRQTVLHECVHAINQIYNYIQADVDPGNDEIYARDISHLQEIVLKIFENEVNSSK